MSLAKRPAINSALRFAERLLLASVFVFAISTPAADAPTIAGEWNIHQSIAGNENDENCIFSVADGKIAGTCKVNEQTPKVSGTVDGKKLTWNFNVEYQGSTLTLTYTASLDDADKFTGSVDVQPYGVTGDFTAARAKSSK
jgi:hypothetical protein